MHELSLTRFGTDGLTIYEGWFDDPELSRRVERPTRCRFERAG
jgi:hypothetical protein